MTWTKLFSVVKINFNFCESFERVSKIFHKTFFKWAEILNPFLNLLENYLHYIRIGRKGIMLGTKCQLFRRTALWTYFIRLESKSVSHGSSGIYIHACQKSGQAPFCFQYINYNNKLCDVIFCQELLSVKISHGCYKSICCNCARSTHSFDQRIFWKFLT